MNTSARKILMHNYLPLLRLTSASVAVSSLFSAMVVAKSRTVMPSKHHSLLDHRRGKDVDLGPSNKKE